MVLPPPYHGTSKVLFVKLITSAVHTINYLLHPDLGSCKNFIRNIWIRFGISFFSLQNLSQFETVFMFYKVISSGYDLNTAV